MAVSLVTARPPARPALLLAAPAEPPPFPFGEPFRLVATVEEGFALAREAAGPGATVVKHALGHPAERPDGPVIEDCTEALFAWDDHGPVGSTGAAAVFALGPTLGLRGFVVVGKDIEEAPLDGPRLQRIAKVLPHVVHQSVQGRRLGHHLLLADALGDLVPDEWREAARGASPLVVPARASLARLREEGIEALDLGDGLAGLPCHHLLTRDDLTRVASAARGAAEVRGTAPGEASPRGTSLGGTSSPEALSLRPLATFEEARDVWPETDNLFATHAWASTWWQHLGEGNELQLFEVREGARAVGLLPLARETKGPLSLVRFVGHGPADRLGPVCAPDDRPLMARALLRAVDDLGADLLIADEVPADEGWAGLLGGVTLRREPSPVLPTHGVTFDAFLASRSRNFREQVRRRERGLRKKHDVVFRLSDDPARLDADLATLHRLHEARWETASDTFAAGPARDFQRAFAHAALAQGWLRLWLLELDGEPVAAWQGFRYANAEWYYQSGRDPERDKQSVGFVLLAHTVREAFDDGVDEYRLLRGGEEYKGRFSAFDPGLEVLAVPRTALGRAAATAVLGTRALPAGMRRRLSAAHRG